jgi:hypothetical protein
MMLRNTLRYELELQNDDIRDDEGVLEKNVWEIVQNTEK